MSRSDEETTARPRGAAEDREAEWEAVAPHRASGREAWVGLFVVVGVLAVITALFLLTDPALLRGRYVTQAEVDQASGIRRGDPVQMRGVNIGRVRGFDIHDQGVLVQLEIEGEYAVPADSRVDLVSTGLLGGMTVRVLPGSADERAGPEDVLPGAVSGGVMEAAEEIGAEAEVVFARIQELLSPATIEAVGTSAEELRVLLDQLSGVAVEQRQSLAALSASLRRSAEGIESAASGPELARIVDRLDALTADAAQTARSSTRAATSLEVVLSRLERGEGTLGRLSTDPSLYESLESAAAGITALAEDIRANPRRYIDLRVF